MKQWASLLSQMSRNTSESPQTSRISCSVLSFHRKSALPLEFVNCGHFSKRWWRCANICYLLKRLFLDTMRRKPVGSVTELSLLFSSSNCWSSKSPASLSVSLLEHPLEDRPEETQMEWNKTECKVNFDCSSADSSSLQGHDLSEKTHTHSLLHTHTWPHFLQAWSNTLT